MGSGVILTCRLRLQRAATPSAHSTWGVAPPAARGRLVCDCGVDSHTKSMASAAARRQELLDKSIRHYLSCLAALSEESCLYE